MHPCLGKWGMCSGKQKNKVRKRKPWNPGNRGSCTTNQRTRSAPSSGEGHAACPDRHQLDCGMSQDSRRGFYKNVPCKACLMRKKVPRGSLLQSSERRCVWGGRSSRHPVCIPRREEAQTGMERGLSLATSVRFGDVRGSTSSGLVCVIVAPAGCVQAASAPAPLGCWHRARGHATKGNASGNGRWCVVVVAQITHPHITLLDMLQKGKKTKKQRENGRGKWGREDLF